MYCRYCGSVVGEQQKFCKQCGKQQQPEAPDQLEDMIVTTAGVFVWICFGLLGIMALKMISEDNYLGVLASMSGGGAVIAAFYLLQKWRQKTNATNIHHQAAFVQSVLEGKDDQHYLAAPNEAVSVVEDETKRFDTDKIVKQQ